MKKLILLIPLALIASVNIRAQSVAPGTLNSAGNTKTIGGNEFDWSVGEMTMVSTFTTPGIIVTQGVLQPDDYLPEGIQKTDGLVKQLQVFPNPATSVVNIKYSSSGNGSLSYRLMDMNSKIITTKTTNVAQGTTLEKVNVADLACATYMLEVTVNAGNGSQETMSYKIQKLK
jgi:hypothetical protein